MEQMKCTIHKNRDAIATCVNCGKPYCSVCLERIGRGYVCFSCLKKVAKESLKKGSYRALTLPIIVTSALFLAMAVAALALNGGLIAAAIGALASSRPETGLSAFVQKNPEALKNMGIAVGQALLFGCEAYLLSMNRSLSFWLGLLLSAAVLFFAMSVPYAALPKESVIFGLMLPFVAFVLILVSKKDLTA